MTFRDAFPGETPRYVLRRGADGYVLAHVPVTAEDGTQRTPAQAVEAYNADLWPRLTRVYAEHAPGTVDGIDVLRVDGDPRDAQRVKTVTVHRG